MSDQHRPSCSADWLRADEAAIWLGTSVGNVRVIAHRRKWRTARVGREALYSTDDVAAEALRRGPTRRPAHVEDSA